MPRTRTAMAPLVAVLGLAGCYRSHDVAPDAGCAPSPPACVVRSGCDAPRLVAPLCDGEAWSCPPGSSEDEDGWQDARCLPFAGELGIVNEAPVPIPIGDECAWLFPTAIVATGDAIENALVPLFGARGCAELELPMDLASAVELAAPGDFVGIEASFVDADGTGWVLARGWEFDASAGFGVRAVGTGFGRISSNVGGSTRIEIAGAWIFDDDVDRGDAAIVHDGFVYAYGCPGDPMWLVEDCHVARAPLDAFTDAAAWSVFDGAGFGDGEPAVVFGSGPHRGPVVPDPRGDGFLHVFIAGFGDRVEVQHAPAPEGPWSAPKTLVACELPSADPDAYCAGPGVYLELGDPREPDRIFVGYSVNSLASDAAARREADPESYWSRIVRASLP